MHIPSGVECISAFILWNRWLFLGLLSALLFVFLFFSGELKSAEVLSGVPKQRTVMCLTGKYVWR